MLNSILFFHSVTFVLIGSFTINAVHDIVNAFLSLLNIRFTLACCPVCMCVLGGGLLPHLKTNSKDSVWFQHSVHCWIVKTSEFRRGFGLVLPTRACLGPTGPFVSLLWDPMTIYGLHCIVTVNSSTEK